MYFFQIIPIVLTRGTPVTAAVKMAAITVLRRLLMQGNLSHRRPDSWTKGLDLEDFIMEIVKMR